MSGSACPTFGGGAHPGVPRVAEKGICYNTFHTTSICSPTRAALLTGRNHHRVASGTIAERAVDWDGYTGVIGGHRHRRRGAGHYGYCTAAFGKWHNSPATQTTAMGPFDRWPTGRIGFDYFYGFIAGETSQWEPRLVENLNPVEPPDDERYHLSEDLADNAISWLRQHHAYAPDALLHVLGPRCRPRTAPRRQGMGRQVPGPVRRRLGRLPGADLPRQQEPGWIPADAKLTPGPRPCRAGTASRSTSGPSSGA